MPTIYNHQSRTIKRRRNGVILAVAATIALALTAYSCALLSNYNSTGINPFLRTNKSTIEKSLENPLTKNFKPSQEYTLQLPSQ